MVLNLDGPLGSNPKSSTAPLGPLHCGTCSSPKAVLGSRAVDPPPWTKQQPSYRLPSSCGPAPKPQTDAHSVPGGDLSRCSNVQGPTRSPLLHWMCQGISQCAQSRRERTGRHELSKGELATEQPRRPQRRDSDRGDQERAGKKRQPHLVPDGNRKTDGCLSQRRLCFRQNPTVRTSAISARWSTGLKR